MINNAKWIGSPERDSREVYNAEKAFIIKKQIKKATLYASALGVYAAWVNGQRVGNYVLAPGWTSYNHRIQYQEYDVTDMLDAENRVSIGVAPGWANGMGWKNEGSYTDAAYVVACLVIEYVDGTSEIISTDTDWEIWKRKIITSEIYHGETVDLTAEPKFVGNAVLGKAKGKLIPQEGEIICEQERIAPVEVIRTPKGETVIDFGQNMTGYVELRIKGERGTRIVMHHAEVLDSDGNFYTDNYRSARNENVYVLSGGYDVFKPTYTFQGFRYIRLTGYPFEQVDLDGLSAVVVHSDMKRTGFFRCGNPKINQLYHNVIWGQKSNYLDVPTDCPQRDERLGWTGDTQVFCRTAAINFDVEKFLCKWMNDLAAEQTEDGGVKGIVPDCLTREGSPDSPLKSAAWGDACCIVPWELYLAYGNKEILKKYLPVMKKWIKFIRNEGPEEYLWLTGVHYGDWLAMDGGPDKYQGVTSNDLTATAYYANSCNLVIKAGKAIGEDVSEYEELYNNIVKRFREYFMENGVPKDEFPLTENTPETWGGVGDEDRKGVTQTALSLILRFNLCTEEERPGLTAKLVQLIEEFDNRISTGFVGTPHILQALSENGRTDLAYTLLMQEKNPSWLYSVCHGATTMWEHWNSLKEDGSFWDKNMNSFNHYAYGAVYSWIFNVAMGISPMEEAPGYKAFTVKPSPCRCLGDFAEAGILTKQGEIKVHWYFKGDDVYYEITVPKSTVAHLVLPSGFTKNIGEGIWHFVEKFVQN